MKKEKKVREPRAKKVKADMTTLPLAISEGKLLVKVKGKVFFERNLEGKPSLHEGEVSEFDGKIVTLWDKTRGQMFSFGVNDSVHIRAASESELAQKVEETPNGS